MMDPQAPPDPAVLLRGQKRCGMEPPAADGSGAPALGGPGGAPTFRSPKRPRCVVDTTEEGTRPQVAQTPFMLFVAHHMRALRLEFPTETLQELKDRLARMWTDLPADERAAFEAKAPTALHTTMPTPTFAAAEAAAAKFIDTPRRASPRVSIERRNAAQRWYSTNMAGGLLTSWHVNSKLPEIKPFVGHWELTFQTVLLDEPAPPTITPRMLLVSPDLTGRYTLGGAQGLLFGMPPVDTRGVAKQRVLAHDPIAEFVDADEMLGYSEFHFHLCHRGVPAGMGHLALSAPDKGHGILELRDAPVPLIVFTAIRIPESPDHHSTASTASTPSAASATPSHLG